MIMHEKDIQFVHKFLDTPTYISVCFIVFKALYFLCLNIFITFTNSVDPNEMQHYAIMLHFILVFTVYKTKTV